ncbi:MAG: hypothetical protein ACKOEH_00115, partial [Actinomycetota bacterium]
SFFSWGLHFAEVTYLMAPLALDAQTVILDGVAFATKTPPIADPITAAATAGATTEPIKNLEALPSLMIPLD